MHSALGEPFGRKWPEVPDVVGDDRATFFSCDLEQDPVATAQQVRPVCYGLNVIPACA